MKADIIKLDYEEADQLAYVLQAFMDDHRDAKAGPGSPWDGPLSLQRAKRVLKRLEAFTSIRGRCGALQPGECAPHQGDMHRCTVAGPHKVHSVVCLRRRKPIRWRDGDTD